MKIALTLSALALSFLPAMAFAACSDKAGANTAGSCMPGQTWDAATGTCTSTPSS